MISTKKTWPRVIFEKRGAAPQGDLRALLTDTKKAKDKTESKVAVVFRVKLYLFFCIYIYIKYIMMHLSLKKV